jgi:hypothetical protein
MSNSASSQHCISHIQIFMHAHASRNIKGKEHRMESIPCLRLYARQIVLCYRMCLHAHPCYFSWVKEGAGGERAGREGGLRGLGAGVSA